ncbi:class I SAM-dependent methyltransferase [Cohnella cholangitidis]|uniref:Class I SAM-dependent methyltransferase n=1 Tax=Cohnella cholangitidis TaxID=2598458 RepID=A0A7G5BY87_9BACL|nr:class I SAM-dependent methyltransferase [Cohnella cholangitidis]QMV41921.1 class I SAM-dependent methyltransferase [Cohnella cholangitidis]
MPDHDSIYKQEASQYHELIASQPSLLDVIERIKPVEGLDIVDMGAGTGRLTAELAPSAKSIVALDAAEAMLHVTADRLREAGLTNWTTQVADHRRLPLADRSADLIVSGWSICYLTNADAERWDDNLDEIIAEMKRVLRPGGTIILFETLGTGHETPSAPDFLQPYYAKLVDTYGFSHRWIRTDYTFADLRQAERLTRFFFGDELADRVVERQLVRLPECAGVWWLQL